MKPIIEIPSAPAGRPHLWIAILLALVAAGTVTASLPDPSDLPVHAALPDPLVMFDRREVTTRAMWVEQRRGELIRLFQHLGEFTW